MMIYHPTHVFPDAICACTYSRLEAKDGYACMNQLHRESRCSCVPCVARTCLHHIHACFARSPSRVYALTVVVYVSIIFPPTRRVCLVSLSPTEWHIPSTHMQAAQLSLGQFPYLHESHPLTCLIRFYKTALAVRWISETSVSDSKTLWMTKIHDVAGKAACVTSIIAAGNRSVFLISFPHLISAERTCHASIPVVRKHSTRADKTARSHISHDLFPLLKVFIQSFATISVELPSTDWPLHPFHPDQCNLMQFVANFVWLVVKYTEHCLAGISGPTIQGHHVGILCFVFSKSYDAFLFLRIMST